jgi:hypothetical protein
MPKLTSNIESSEIRFDVVTYRRSRIAPGSCGLENKRPDFYGIFTDSTRSRRPLEAQPRGQIYARSPIMARSAPQNRFNVKHDVSSWLRILESAP